MSVAEWPEADRLRWEALCQPGARLRRGGAAAHLKPISRNDLARRYGYFLDHLHRVGCPLSGGTAADQVTPANVSSYLEALRNRVGSVTVYGSISKLRRMAELLNPALDLAWLRDIEADLDLMKQPKSKMSKLVDTSSLVEAGLTLLYEAELEPDVSPYRSITLQSREALRRARGAADRAALNRAVLARDGLIVALLALCPIRLQNFAALELGRSLVNIGDCWWIVLDPEQTKSARPDERPVPELLSPHTDRYLSHHRAVLGRGQLDAKAGAVWISSADGNACSYAGVEHVIRRTTRRTLGIEIGPHMFRACAATTASAQATHLPGLASALLQHVDPRVTERHYNRATAHDAAKAYAKVLMGIADGG